MSDHPQNKIIMPIGMKSGREVEVVQALEMMAQEMLGRRQYLREQAIRSASPTERAIAAALSSDLERFGLCLWLLWWQAAVQEGKPPPVSREILTLARQHHLTLPAGMESPAD
jgi:hypothetical protein